MKANEIQNNPPTDAEINAAYREFHMAEALWTKLNGQTPENTARFHLAIAMLDHLRARNNGQYITATYDD